LGIQIVDKNERLSFTTMGVKFFYRRVLSHEQAAIEKRHTKRGVSDDRAVLDEVLRTHILGWEADPDAVTDSDGNELPFSPALLASLPEEAKGDIVGKLYEASPQDRAGN
jgi:hypothetical protein